MFFIPKALCTVFNASLLQTVWVLLSLFAGFMAAESVVISSFSDSEEFQGVLTLCLRTLTGDINPS